MRALSCAALLLAAGCSSAPPPAPLEVTDATTADEVAGALRAGRAWKDEADRGRGVRLLASKADRRHVDALFLVLERDKTPENALAAIAGLAPLLSADDLPKLDALLGGADPTRVLILLRQARLGGAVPLLEKHAAELLASKAAARVALGTLGALRVRGATQPVLDYLGSDDDDAAYKALGRLWEQKLDAPALAREDERTRLTVLIHVVRPAMVGGDGAACDAMLRIMTRAELDELLAKNAKDRFKARAAMAEACARESFDAKKGAMVHAALLANPDADVVAFILWSSPHVLDVRVLLGDERAAKLRGQPDARVCDYAAARLEADAAKRPTELPASAEERAALLKKWRDKQPH